MKPSDYWEECISSAAESINLDLTYEQVKALAESVEIGVECYGMAFYSPPDSDRYNDIEREWKQKYDALKKDYDNYVNNAEYAVKVALKVYPAYRVTIGSYGEVRLHNGRADRIQ